MTKLDLFRQYKEKRGTGCTKNKEYFDEPFTCGNDELRELWYFYHHPDGHNGVPSRDLNIAYIRQDLEVPYPGPVEEYELNCGAEYQQSGHNLTVILSPAPGLSESWEYAYYLYKDNEIIDRTGYSKTTQKTYTGISPGSYRVKFFIKFGQIKKSFLVKEINIS